MRTFRNFVSWGLALLLIGVFVHLTIHPIGTPAPGHVKFYDLPGDSIVFTTLAERSGLTLFEPLGRVAAGVLELLAALLLLFPFSRRLGALIATAILGTGVGLHLSPWLGRELPLAMGDATQTDGGQMFMLAVGLLAASLLLLIAHPGRPRDD